MSQLEYECEYEYERVMIFFKKGNLSTDLPKTAVKGVDSLMMGAFFVSFLSILLHIIIDNERQKIEKENKSKRAMTINICVSPIGGAQEEAPRRRTKTCIQRIAVFMAKIFFPLLNLTSIVVFFYFNITVYIDQSDNRDSFIDMAICNLLANVWI